MWSRATRPRRRHHGPTGSFQGRARAGELPAATQSEQRIGSSGDVETSGPASGSQLFLRVLAVAGAESEAFRFFLVLQIGQQPLVGQIERPGILGAARLIAVCTRMADNIKEEAGAVRTNQGAQQRGSTWRLPGRADFKHAHCSAGAAFFAISKTFTRTARTASGRRFRRAVRRVAPLRSVPASHRDAAAVFQRLENRG